MSRRLTNIAAGAGSLSTLAATVQREFDNLYKSVQVTTITGTLPISVAENDVSIRQASASQDGYLSAVDYARFSDAASTVLLSGNVTAAERAHWDSAYAHALITGANPHAARLDQIADPAASKLFAFGVNHLGLRFTNPSTGSGYDGAFEIDGVGNFTGDLLHVHHSAGTASAAQDVLHVETHAASSATPLRVSAQGTDRFVIASDGTHTVNGNVNQTGYIYSSGEVRGLSLRAYVDGSNYLLANNDVNNFYWYAFGKSLYIGAASATKYLVFVSAGVGVGSWTDTNISIGTNATHGDGKTMASTTFGAGYFGGGWKLDYSAGQGYTLELDNLVVRNTLRAFIFQKDIVRASNGYLFISDVSEIVYATGIASGDTDLIYIKENVFQVGDKLWYKDIDETTGLVITGIKCRVTAVNGSVTLPTGGKTGFEVEVASEVGSAGTFRVGGTIVRVGSTQATRQGSIYFDASSGTAPYMDVYDGVSDWPEFLSIAKMKVRLGKLTGITTDASFGALSGYGLYSQNLYLTGNAQIYGNLAAGGMNGPGATFFAGRIGTNLLTKHSERFSTWSNNADPGITWTDLDSAAPDGATTATKWVRSGGTNPYKYNNTTTQCQSKTFTASVWMKGAAGGESVSIYIARWGDYVTIASSTVTLTTGWQRFVVTGTANGTNPTNTAYVTITQLTNPSTIYTWGAQLEESPTVSVYQRVDGSATYSGAERYGMWAAAGGFAGTIQAPVVFIGAHGLTINHAGIATAALATQSIMIGEVTGTAVSAIKIANTGTGSTSGLFGYDSGGTESFKLALDGTAKIAGWTFTSAQLSNNNFRIQANGTTFNGIAYEQTINSSPYDTMKIGQFTAGSINNISINITGYSTGTSSPYFTGTHSWTGDDWAITGSGNFSAGSTYRITASLTLPSSVDNKFVRIAGNFGSGASDPDFYSCALEVSVIGHYYFTNNGSIDGHSGWGPTYFDTGWVLNNRGHNINLYGYNNTGDHNPIANAYLNITTLQYRDDTPFSEIGTGFFRFYDSGEGTSNRLLRGIRYSSSTGLEIASSSMGVGNWKFAEKSNGDLALYAWKNDAWAEKTTWSIP